MIASHVKELKHIYRVAIDSVKPDRLVKNSLKLKNKTLIIRQKQDVEDLKIDLDNCNVHVIGGGKSVLKMATGLAEVFAESTGHHREGFFSYGCLSLPFGLKQNLDENKKHQQLLKSISVEPLFGSQHNLPDENSIHATKSILRKVNEAILFDKIQKKQPLFIILLSGGGSACLTHPNHIKLDQKLGLIRFLTQKGANIVELNKVRRYFSQVKGGQLAKFILNNDSKARIVTLIISDVIGDPLEYIASGPTYIDNGNLANHYYEMLTVLGKYNYTKLEKFVVKDDEICPNSIDYNENIANIVIGNNSVVLETVKVEAEKLGYKVVIVGDDLAGNTEEIVTRLICAGNEIYQQSNPIEKLLVIGGGEATVCKKDEETWGLGGRVQEMALDYMIKKISSPVKSSERIIDIFLSASTDGQDGPTDVGACYASFAAWENNQTFQLNEAINSKSKHDSYNFWIKVNPENLIKTGLTGTNVMDLYMYCLIRN